MRKLLIAAVFACLVVPAHTFAQTSNATLGGTVSDATGALIPGVTVTATNTGTGIVTTVMSNEAGAYQFASLQTGTYKVSAELPGFQTADLQQRYAWSLAAGAVELHAAGGSLSHGVEVTVAADTLIATTSSSVGTVLPEYKVRDLPLGSRNVMDLSRDDGAAAGRERRRYDCGDGYLCRRADQRGEYDARRLRRIRRAVQPWRIFGDVHQSRSG